MAFGEGPIEMGVMERMCCLGGRGGSPLNKPQLCPWDSPGRNTGAGCHCLLQGISRPRDGSRVSCMAAGFSTPVSPGRPSSNADSLLTPAPRASEGPLQSPWSLGSCDPVILGMGEKRFHTSKERTSEALTRGPGFPGSPFSPMPGIPLTEKTQKG